MESILKLFNISELNTMCDILRKYINFSKIDKTTLSLIFDFSKLTFGDTDKFIIPPLNLNDIISHDKILIDIKYPLKVDNIILGKICNLSNLTLGQISDILINELNSSAVTEIIAIIFPDKLISRLSVDNFKSIKFDEFDEKIRQIILNWLIINNVSTDKICVLLDKMESVNYGDGTYGFLSDSILTEVNPLIYCCKENKIDLVKLLVEKYNANIEYLSYWNTTAIMYSAQGNHKEITKYLYNSGAKLYTDKNETRPSKTIDLYATPKIIESIKKWKKLSEMKNSPVITKYSEADYEKLKRELDDMKHNYENILELVKTTGSSI